MTLVVWRRIGLALALLATAIVPSLTTARADGLSAWVAGPGASGDNTLAGAIDSPADGSNATPNSSVVVSGWVVDTTASGWTGIDAVDVYLGLQDQGGPLIAHANVGVRRDDVAAAFGNSYWANSGYSISFSESGLAAGANTLTIYAHTPDRGWWYRQVQVNVPAAPDRPYADDPLLIVRSISPASDVNYLNILHTTETL